MLRQYSRIFVTLKQEKSDYSHNGRQALGRCIIESKDNSSKISVYVQDLKPEILYKLYIVSCQGGRSVGVPLGTINVDERGKCEAKWELNAGNVGGSGLSIEEFNVITLNIPKKNDIIAVLTGFTNGTVMWKNNYTDFSEVKDEIPHFEESPRAEKSPQAKLPPQAEQPLQAKLPPHEEPRIQKDTTEENSSVKEKTLEAVHMAFKEIVSKFNSEMEMLQNYSLDDMEESEADDIEVANVQPFGDKQMGIAWSKISLKELASMKLSRYMDIPLIVAGHRKYKHLLLGKFDDKDNYILGIPENYSHEEESEAVMLGFRFVNYDGGENIEGCFGYWLLDI